MLSKSGLRVDAALTGMEALVMNRSCTYGVILMDIMMPGMDGLEATKKLRDGGCTAPIIGCSASAETSDKQRCLDAGMTDFLSKPINRKALVRKVKKYLQ